MSNTSKVLAVIGFIGVLLLCGILGVVTDVINFGVDQTVDFVQEQNPQAESLGELIGTQYSQLRELSASLDDTACRIDTVKASYSGLQEIYADEGSEANWPETAQEEARGYRDQITNLNIVYSDIAADYNVLRTDIRTIADNLGLEVDEIPEANALSPDGVCGNFDAPFLPDLDQ